MNDTNENNLQDEHKTLTDNEVIDADISDSQGLQTTFK